MKTLVLVGDPQNISAAMSEIHNNNSKFKVISLAACTHFIQPERTSILKPAPNQGLIPVNVLYVTYDGPVLVDKDGKELQGQ